MKLFIPNLLANAEAGFWFPPQASKMAEPTDSVYFFILYVCTFFFVLIVGLMVWFMIKYRYKPGVEVEKTPSHNLTLELSWSVIPTILVVIMFWVGFTAYLDMRTPPSSAYEIDVIAKKWSWSFKYPNGWIESELHVPKDQNVTLTMTSDDVIHDLYVPAFRTKMDIVPGRYTQLWFNAIEAGKYPLMCAEYCGQKHSEMISNVVVHETRGDFDKWLKKASNIHDNMEPKKAGEYFYKTRGCIQCHSIDGTKKNGPTFKGLIGRERKFTDGTSIQLNTSTPAERLAARNYVTQSILEPQAKIVDGFRPIMPTFKGQLTDQDISAIFAYIESLK